MNKTLLFCSALLLPASAYSDTTSISFDTGSFTINGTSNSTALAIGSVVEFGFYSSSTSSDLFNGTWTSIAGGTSANTAFSGTFIGNNPASDGGAGTYATGSGLVFDTTKLTTSTILPSAGKILAVRFYNDASVMTSTHYAAASNSNWLWTAPSSNGSFIGRMSNLDDVGTLWEAGNVAFTGISTSAVPEPATYATLFGLGVLGLAVYRRRRTVA